MGCYYSIFGNPVYKPPTDEFSKQFETIKNNIVFVYYYGSGYYGFIRKDDLINFGDSIGKTFKIELVDDKSFTKMTFDEWELLNSYVRTMAFTQGRRLYWWLPINSSDIHNERPWNLNWSLRK